MSPLEIFLIALQALGRNKTRSFLTTLGMIIGVAAVIASVAIGEGAKANVEEQFQSMGTNLLILTSGSSNQGGARGGFGSQPTLTWTDLKAIQSEVPSVKAAAAVLTTSASIASEEQNWTTRVSGTSPEYLIIRNWKVVSGQPFNTSDVESGAKVVLLGQTVVDNLFGANADPVGQLVRIKGIPFQVIGVLDKKGQSAMGQDFDDAALIPYSTYETKIQGGLGKFVPGMVFISAASSDLTQKAQSQVSGLLRDRHHLTAEDDFQIRNLQEIANAQEASAQTFSLLLAVVAALSLVVGGVGIMNIMLVSVTERTREIGLRMAIGAKPMDVLLQFLVEALTLSTAGGVLGVLIGVGVGHWMGVGFHWKIAIRPDVIVVAVLFSALVGIGFGLYPARKASLLDPIEALRYE